MDKKARLARLNENGWAHGPTCPDECDRCWVADEMGAILTAPDAKHGLLFGADPALGEEV